MSITTEQEMDMDVNTSVVGKLAMDSYNQRKSALDMANAAAAKKGLTLEEMGVACNLLPIRVGAILSGQAPLEKPTQDRLEKLLDLEPGSLDPLAPCPVRWQSGAIYRLHEAIEVYGPALQRWFNERFGDSIMSAIDFTITTEETVGKHGERRIRIVFDGKALPYSTDEDWRPSGN